MVFLSPVGQFQGDSQFQLPAGRGDQWLAAA